MAGTVIATFLCIVIAAVIWGVYTIWYEQHLIARRNVLAVGMGGAAGALFSILLRVGRAPLDPAAGKTLHQIEGAVRVIVGLIGAIIILSAIRAGLLLPELPDPYGIFLVCVVAGASERCASAVIERVEGALMKSEKAPSKRKNET